MTRHSRLHVLLALAWLVLSAGLLPTVAQEPSGASAAPAVDEPLAQEARDLRVAVEETIENIATLKGELPTAEGEDRLVMQRRIGDARLEGLDELQALTANLLSQEEVGLDTTELRGFLEPLLRRVDQGIHEIIDDLEVAASESGADRESLSPGDLEALEQELAQDQAKIDRYYEALASNVTQMQSLGMTTEEEESSLRKELEERAESAATRVKLALDERADLAERLKSDAANADLQAELRALEERLNGTTASLASTTELLKGRGFDTTEYQRLLIEATGTITTDLLDTKVVLSLTQKWLDQGKTWLAESGPNLLFKLLVFILILFLFRILAKVVRRVVKKTLSTSKLNFSQLLQDLLINLSSRAVMLLGLLVALSQIGFTLGPLLAGLGVAGFIVGFALQDTLGNFAAGAMILIYRPFDVGDLVEAGTVMGKVEKMTLVSTTILTLDYQTLIVPNNKIWGDVIKNVTAQRIRRVDMTFGISYSDDIPHAEKVLEAILAEHEKVLKDPEPNVRLHTLGESSVDFVVRPWVNTDDYWDVYWDVTREVKMRFDREGISIPFPQRDVHLFPETPAAGASSAQAAT